MVTSKVVLVGEWSGKKVVLASGSGVSVPCTRGLEMREIGNRYRGMSGPKEGSRKEKSWRV